MSVRNTTKTDEYWNGGLVGRVKDVNVSVDRDELETTGVGQVAATSAKGVRKSQVSCTFLYDPDNAGAVAMANSIWDDSEDFDTLRCITRRGSSRADFVMEVFAASLGAPIRVRELMSCSMNLTVNGDVSGRF